MLQKLNEKIQGLVAWVVISLVAVTFTLFGIDYYLQSRQAGGAVAKVDGAVISKQEFELNLRRARNFREQSQQNKILDAQYKNILLEEMVTNRLVVNAAKGAGFDVSNSLANSTILRIPQLQEDGHFSEIRYQHALSAGYYTPESFQQEVRQGMLINQQRFAISGTSFAMPYEVDRFIKLYMQTRDYSYLEISPSHFYKNIEVTSKEIDSFYEAHKKMFSIPKKVQLEYVKLSMDDIRHEVKVKDADVKRFYEENKANYQTPAEWKVAHILINSAKEPKAALQGQAAEIYKKATQKDADFFALAKKYSTDKLSLTKNAELPWIVAGTTPYDKALVQLTEIGEVSKPLETQKGYEIFKLIAYKPAQVKPYSEVKDSIQNLLVSEKVQALYANKLETLTDLSYQAPDSLTQVAESLNLKIMTAEPFSQKGGSTGIAQNKDVVRAAFSKDVYDLGNNSEPVQLNSDSVIVLRIKEKIPANIKLKNEVVSEIKANLVAEKAKARAQELGEKLLSNIANTARANALLAKYGLKWKSLKDVTRDTERAPREVNEIAYNILQVGEYQSTTTEQGAYALVKLTAINPGKKADYDKEQLASITEQLEASYGIMDYDLFINGLQKSAKVETTLD